MTANPDILLILAASLLGGLAGRLLRLPGGALLLAAVAVALAHNLLGLSNQMPENMVLFMQILVGCMLGQSINRGFWRDLLTIWRPCLTVLLLYSLSSLPLILLMVKIWSFDPVTAVLAANPARMQDMVILAGSLGLDAVLVMLMQFCRQLVIIVITPFLLVGSGRSCGKLQKRPGAGVFRPPQACRLRAVAIDYAILLLPAGLGGWLGRLLWEPLGAMIGAFLLVAASRLLSPRAGRVDFPRPFALLVQCLAGILLGLRVTPDLGGLVLERGVLLALGVLSVLAAGLLITAILRRRFGWSRALAWMSAAPGRGSDMLAIAQDLELQPSERLAMASVHTARQVYFTLLATLVVMFWQV